MSRRSITFSHLLWTWGFFLLVLSGVFIFAADRAEQAALAEAEDRARRSLDLARYLLRSHPAFGSDAELAAYVDSLGPHLGFRLTYIVSGKVDIAGEEFGAGQLLVFKPGDRISILAVDQSRLMLVGGEPLKRPMWPAPSKDVSDSRVEPFLSRRRVLFLSRRLAYL